MKEKLFWPLIAISIVAVLIIGFMVFDSDDDDEIAAQFIPGYKATETASGASRVGAASPNIPTASNVTVNGKPLSGEALISLTGGQGTVSPGRYWYDARSGLWGIMGGPTRGKIQPGLRIGGSLPANASGGGTDIFFNGREIHPIEVQYILQVLGTAIPGRYWLNADMTGGPEGGPRLFSLAAAQGYNRNTAGGSILGDGRGCSGVLVPGRPGGPSTTVSSGC